DRHGPSYPCCAAVALLSRKIAHLARRCVISPWIHPLICTPRGVFPFRGRGQSFPHESAINGGLLLVDAIDRMSRARRIVPIAVPSEFLHLHAVHTPTVQNAGRTFPRRDAACIVARCHLGPIDVKCAM